MVQSSIYVFLMVSGFEVIGEYSGDRDGFKMLKHACMLQVPKPGHIGLNKYAGKETSFNTSHIMVIQDAPEPLIALWRQAKSGLLMPANAGPNGVPAIPS